MSQAFYHTKTSGRVRSADRSGTETSPVPWQMVDENIMDMYVLFSAGGACYKQKTVENSMPLKNGAKHGGRERERRRCMLTEADRSLLNEVYRSSKAGVDAVHAVIAKVYDDDLALDLNRLAYEYSRIEERASSRLYENGFRPKGDGLMEQAARWGNLQINTLTNISTEHIARLMIQDSAGKMLAMKQMMRDQTACGKMSMELAEELTGFEKKAIRRLKAYVEE